jgi:hypothetical protein
VAKVLPVRRFGMISMNFRSGGTILTFVGAVT